MDPDKDEGNHEAGVSFRIYAPGLEPDEITQLLGVAPHHAHREGDYPRGNPKYSSYKHGMWSLDSPLPRDKPLEAHLDAVLSILDPKAPAVRALAGKAAVDFICTVYGPQGVGLSAEIIARLAQLGAAFGVVIYPDDATQDLDSQPIFTAPPD